MKTHHHLRTALFSALLLLLCTVSFANTWQTGEQTQTDQTWNALNATYAPGDLDASHFSLLKSNAASIAQTDQTWNALNATYAPDDLPVTSISNVVNDANRQTIGANNYTLANAAQNWQTAGNYLKNVALYDVSQQIFYFTIANTNAGSGNQKQKNEGNTDGTPAIIFSSLSSMHAANSTGIISASVPDYFFVLAA